MTSTLTESAARDRIEPAKPALAAAVTVVLWASAFVGIRSVGHTFGAGPVALGRLAVGTVALTVLVLIRRPAMPHRRDLLPIVAYGLAWFGGYNVALNAAEQHLDAGTSAILITIGPVLVALLAGVFLHEGFSRQLIIGTALALAGVVVIGIGAADTHSADLRGVTLCVLAAVLYAVSVVVQKPVLRRVPALTATWLGCAVGTLACVPFSPELVRQTGDASAHAILGLIYLGLFPTAVAFTTWAYALARTSAGKLGATTYLVPAVATLISWAVLDEIPHLASFLGGVLCLVGVAISRLRTRSS